MMFPNSPRVLPLVTVIVLFTVHLAYTQTNICELKQEIIYCNCDEAEVAQDVMCFATSYNTNEDDPVWNYFSSQNRISSLKLTAFQNRTLNFMPKKVLKILKNSLTIFRTSGLNITTLETKTFENMDSLIEVEISLSYRMQAQPNVFVSLPNLEKVVFSKNNLTVLPNMFENVPKLEEVYLEDNNIQRIEDNAFSGLSGLVYLALDRNMISHLNRKTFTGLHRLSSLDILRNLLTRLEAYTFSELKQVQLIDLSHNQIDTIDVKAFAGLENLQQLKLGHNRLRTLPPGGVFSNPKLAIIELDFNNFEHLSRQVFYQIERKSYIQIKVRGNKLQCTCCLYWLKEALDPADSINIKELDTIGCLDENGKPADSNLSIYKFLMDRKTEQECYLPPPPSPNEFVTKFVEVPIETIEKLQNLSNFTNKNEEDQTDVDISDINENSDRKEEQEENENFENENNLNQAAIGKFNEGNNSNVLYLNTSLLLFLLFRLCFILPKHFRN